MWVFGGGRSVRVIWSLVTEVRDWLGLGERSEIDQENIKIEIVFHVFK